MKILLLSNQSRSMSIFWRVLISAMLARGCEVVCCVPPGDGESDSLLEKTGARVIHYNLDRKGLNPFRDAAAYFSLCDIFAREQPDAIFATTIKPVIYGCLAAGHIGIKNVFATITGLGYAFEADSPFKKVINRISRVLYKTALARAKGIFFQNRDDHALFVAQGILAPETPVFFARGTGVDTDYFSENKIVPPAPGETLTFILVGRLLEAKGIREFVQAAEIIHKTFPNARFQILGPEEHGPGSLGVEYLRSHEPLITWLGQTSDVRPYLQAAHVVVLPSWREGVPTSLMEAMSTGRPLIATDVPGCREVIKNGVNGFLTKPKDPESLALAMRKFLEDPELIATMGKAGRKLAVDDFDATRVAEKILDDMGIIRP